MNKPKEQRINQELLDALKLAQIYVRNTVHWKRDLEQINKVIAKAEALNE